MILLTSLVDNTDALQQNLQMCSQGNTDDGDMVAANHLEFLTLGRRILLEDTTILQDQYSKCRIFNLPCFKLLAEEHLRTPMQQNRAAYKAEVSAAHSRMINENLQVRLRAFHCQNTIAVTV